WLWAPDPATVTEATSATAGSLRGSVAATRWNLELGSPRGELQVLALAANPPQTVAVNGAELPRFADAAALRAAPSGWAPAPGPIGDVVIKLTQTHAAAPDPALPATGADVDVAGLWPALAAAAVAIVRRLTT